MRIACTLFFIVLFIGCKKGEEEKKEMPTDNSSTLMLYVRLDTPNRRLNIFTNDITGTNEKQILLQPIDANSKAIEYVNWGANGRIYFLSNFNGGDNLQIYSIKSDGSEVKQVSNCQSCLYSDLRVSPQNNRLLYRKYNTINTRLILATSKLDGTDEREVLVLDEVESARFMSWYPDGNKIIFKGVEEVNGTSIVNLYSINLDGTGQMKITNNTWGGVYYYNPFVSPDGKKIVYTKNTFSDPHVGVYTCNVDGTDEQLILPFSSFPTGINGNWSKDSKSILILEEVKRPFIMNADGTSKKSIFSTSCSYPIFKDF